MKKVNLAIIVVFIATFVVSIFVFQPTTTKASNNVSPSATPGSRKVKQLPGGIPIPQTSKVTRIKTINGFYTCSGGTCESEKIRRNPKATMQYNPKELSVDKMKKTKNGYTAMPELDANSNARKRQTPKSSKAEVSIETLERRKQPRRKIKN